MMAAGFAIAGPPLRERLRARGGGRQLDGKGGMAPPITRPPLGRRRRRGPARLLDRLDAGLGESEAQHFLGVAEGQAARLRAQHDEEKALTGAPGGDGEVVARFPREAGLESLHAPGILEEGDAAGVHALLEDEAAST